MANHSRHVWRNYIEPAGFQRILILAHSAGGAVVTAIMREFSETFFNKVQQVAYTDATSIIKPEELSAAQQGWLENSVVHYSRSKAPLGTHLNVDGCLHVSAGTTVHTYTTGAAWPMIQQQFDRILK